MIENRFEWFWIAKWTFDWLMITYGFMLDNHRINIDLPIKQDSPLWRSHKQRGTKRHLNLSSRLIIIIVHTNNSWRGWTCSEALFHQDMGDECQTSCSRGNGADIWLPQFTAYRIIEPERSLLEILVSLTQFAHYNKITLHWSSFKSVTSYKHLMENRWKTAQLNMRTTICMSQQRWHRYPIKDVAHQRNKGVGQQLRCSSQVHAE